MNGNTGPALAVPRTVTVDEFARAMNIPLSTAYAIAKRMPESIKLKLDHRVRLLAEPLEEWLRAGGTRGDGQS